MKHGNPHPHDESSCVVCGILRGDLVPTQVEVQRPYGLPDAPQTVTLVRFAASTPGAS